MATLGAATIEWIEKVTEGRVAQSRQVAAGGRDGFAVDVARGGETLALFLQMGRGDAAAGTSFMPVEREAEVMLALHKSDIRVPKVWAVDAKQQAILVERVPGRTWMHAPVTPEEQDSVAKDFMRHLAKLHRLDPRDLDLPSFKPVRSAREHQCAVVQEMQLRAAAGHTPIEPILRISLDYLERHLPDYDGPTVLVQGDTGPGNFMYDAGKVTGVIDWELAHLGDPMDDIAWLSWRTTQHTFTHLPDRLREYEDLSGIAIDAARVTYYRVNACVRLAATGSGPWGGFGLAGMGDKARDSSTGKAVTAEADRGADGSAFIFTILHRRMRLEALMAALGIAAPVLDALPEAPPKPYGHMYDDILTRLQNAVARIEDRTAANLVKGVARSVKYLKEADRNAVLFERLELEDIGEMLGRPQSSIDAGRRSLYAAAAERQIGDEAYVLYHWRRFLRDEELMRVAASSLYQRSWPPLH